MKSISKFIHTFLDAFVVLFILASSVLHIIGFASMSKVIAGLIAIMALKAMWDFEQETKQNE